MGISSASSSPVFEAYLATNPTNATSTIFWLGYSTFGQSNDWGASGSTQSGVSGFYFIATSSATGTWMAVAKEVGQAQTMIDTGIASTSATVSGSYHKFRVMVSVAPNGQATATYFIDDVVRAVISPPRGTKTILNPVVSVGTSNDGAAGLAKSIRVSYIRAWADLIPSQN
jgi:hypothetical protein